jgi:hypothetical protein
MLHQEKSGNPGLKSIVYETPTRRMREMMRKSERTKMKGLRRPQREKQSSDRLPISGTVYNAIKGAEKERQ